jgi:dCTP deaminase
MYMILSDSAILKAIKKKEIIIEPFNPKCVGPNSYDLHMSGHLAEYESPTLDAKVHNAVRHFEIPEDGFVLLPGHLYLCSTVEYTENPKFVPILDGKSSVGRLGICINSAAGTGDVGFCNHWTLHLSVILPVRVYAGMPIGQLLFYKVKGRVSVPYNKIGSSKYSVKRTDLPQESMMWKNKFFKAQASTPANV